jgi:hypothetical protein
MTLVLTFMSRDYALMVGDTQLCVRDAETGKFTPLEGDAIKFEHIRGLLFCFAGVANFTRIPTSDWLRERFERSGLGLDAGLAALAQDLDLRFQRKDVKGLPLTVTIVGWVLDDSETLRPIVATVTNQHPETFEQLASFNHSWSTLPADGGWVSTGQISQQREAQLKQTIEKALQQPVTPDVVANIFLSTLREEAAENVTVGDRARVATLPLPVLHHALERNDDHIVVWRSHEPVLVDGQPMVIELAPDELRVTLVTVDQADFSKARIID